jgi:hypothetical protein
MNFEPLTKLAFSSLDLEILIQYKKIGFLYSPLNKYPKLKRCTPNKAEALYSKQS